MNAAETIAAAIEKLEGLKVAVAPAPWTAVRSEADLSWQVHCSEWGHVLSTGYVGNGDSQPTAELIAMLHGTIDAQLAILTWFTASLELAPDYGPPEDNPFMSLARSILGDMS
jgi:hypothetical protein